MWKVVCESACMKLVIISVHCDHFMSYTQFVIVASLHDVVVIELTPFFVYLCVVDTCRISTNDAVVWSLE